MRPRLLRLLSCGVLCGVAACAAAAAPLPGGRPAVSGTLQVGHRLATTPGSWSGSGPVAYAYNWYRCDSLGAHCLSIHGATGATYTAVARDVRHTLGAAVRATDASGTTSGYASLAGPIAAAGDLAATAQPTLEGIPTAGGTLSVAGARWSTAPDSSSVTWLRCNANVRLCAPIADAAGTSYAVAAADAGHTLVAQVTATAGAQRATVLSVASPLVRGAAGPAAVSPPTVTGIARQGRKLLAAAGSWSGTGAVRYAYNWYRCDSLGAHCLSIHGATGAGYTQVARDVGKTIGLSVRATDSSGTTTEYTSLVGPVAGSTGLASTVQPTIAGAAVAGQTLVAGAGRWTEATSSTTVAWLRCNPNGRLCESVDGAAAATYTVTAADAGHTLVAAVTATAGDERQTALSLATPVVT